MDERLQFVARRLAGEPMAELCREFAISRKTGYKIFDRYQESGVQGLTDRSRRPYRFGRQLPFQIPNCLAYEAGAKALPLWEEIWPGPAMKLVGTLAARSPGLRLALALEIEGHCSADEILQGRLIDLVAFVDVDGAPDIPVEAGVE